jgi:hypothetical protein
VRDKALTGGYVGRPMPSVAVPAAPLDADDALAGGETESEERV